MRKLSIRHIGNLPADHSLQSALYCRDVSRTVQEQAVEADINNIVAAFGVTKQLPYNGKIPLYGDYTEAVTDYRTAIDTVREADKAFMALPSEFRASLGNDPQKFLEYCADPSNLETIRTMGFAVAPPQSQAVPTPPPTPTT